MPDNITTQQTFLRQNKGWGIFWKAIKVIFSFFGAVGTGLAIYQWYKYIGADPHVRFSIVDNQCLTRVAEIPNLESQFIFDGRSVDALWVSRVLLVNDCQRNIIGTAYRDLMSSNISFSVSAGYKVLKVVDERNDFDAQILSNENGFCIAFNKWRPEEMCLLNVYCEGDHINKDVVGPRFSEKAESFTQGKLQISEYLPFSEPVSLLKHLPYWVSFCLLWVGRIVYAFIIALCLWGVLINIDWLRIYKRLKWNRKYLPSVEAILSHNKMADDKNSLNVNKLPGNFWQDNHIPKPPRYSIYVKGNKIDWSELAPILVLCAIGFILSFIALSGLIYF